MHIAILTSQGFNELDSLVALGVLNHIKYLAAWIIARFHGEDAARGALTTSPRLRKRTSTWPGP